MTVMRRARRSALIPATLALVVGCSPAENIDCAGCASPRMHVRLIDSAALGDRPVWLQMCLDTAARCSGPISVQPKVRGEPSKRVTDVVFGRAFTGRELKEATLMTVRLYSEEAPQFTVATPDTTTGPRWTGPVRVLRAYESDNSDPCSCEYYEAEVTATPS